MTTPPNKKTISPNPAALLELDLQNARKTFASQLDAFEPAYRAGWLAGSQRALAYSSQVSLSLATAWRRVAKLTFLGVWLWSLVFTAMLGVHPENHAKYAFANLFVLVVLPLLTLRKNRQPGKEQK